MWRQVGALSMSSFVAVLTGTGVALAQSTARSAADRMLLADIRACAVVTLAISFVTVAARLAINQAAAVLDRREVFVGLDIVGMPVRLVDAARRRAVLKPLLAAVGVGVGSAVVLALPLGAARAFLQPSSMLLVAGVLVAGLTLVRFALAATRRIVAQVVGAGRVRVEQLVGSAGPGSAGPTESRAGQSVVRKRCSTAWPPSNASTGIRSSTPW